MARPSRCRSPPEPGGDYTYALLHLWTVIKRDEFHRMQAPHWSTLLSLAASATALTNRVRVHDWFEGTGRPTCPVPPAPRAARPPPPPNSAARRSRSPSLLPKICDRCTQGGSAAGARVHLWTEFGASASPPRPRPILECWHIIGPRSSSCRLQLPLPRPAAREARAAHDPGCLPGPAGGPRGKRPPPRKRGRSFAVSPLFPCRARWPPPWPA